MSHLSKYEQTQVYEQTMNVSAARRRSEERERELLFGLLQSTELLYGILVQLSGGTEFPDVSDLIFSTNSEFRANEAARQAAEAVADADAERAGVVLSENGI